MGQSLHRSETLPKEAPILRGNLSQEVRAFLLEAIPADTDALKALGFEEHSDHPSIPGHKYMEGYFHAVSAAFGGPVPSIHPRLGCQLDRMMAPSALVAFCEAFRRENSDFFGRLQSELLKHQNHFCLASLLERHMHFADLSIQVHWGDAVPHSDVAWHIDAPNSFLHLAVGLSGKRALHARRNVVNGRVSKQCLVGGSDNREVFPMQPGDVYLSTPCCFPHAVEYEACSWEDRVVAVQIRLLLSEDEMFNSLGTSETSLDSDPQGGTAAIVFRQIAAQMSSGLVMPSLTQIRDVMEELQEGIAK